MAEQGKQNVGMHNKQAWAQSDAKRDRAAWGCL